MAAIGAHPKHRPPIKLYICKSETDQGKLVTDAFVWRPDPHERSLWVYLRMHAQPQDWQSIHYHVGPQTSKAYHLKGTQITEANVTKMQHNIASGPGAVSIYLVLKSGAVPKTSTATAPRAVLGGARPAPATNSDHLRELLDELSGINNRYRRYIRK